MKTTVDSTQVTQAIRDILAENKTRTWMQSSLVRAVASRLDWNRPTPIGMAIKTMVQIGAINGTVFQNKAKNIRWKDPVQQQQMQPQTNGMKPDAGLIATLNEMKAEAAKAKQVEAQLKAELEKAQKAPGIVEIKLTKQDGKTESIKGLFHEQLPKLIKLANRRKNIYIYGPTGCGKSHIAKQVAEALNLRFAFISCTAGMSEGHISGRLLPVGKGGTFEYVQSEFVDCYENGGVFLLDEIDAADPNVLLLINAALANGHMALPNRPAKPVATKHKDFIMIAAANTVGTGADRLYSGRNKLDAATLDRFAIGKVLMGYDERVEEKLCPDATLRATLTKYRKRIMEHRLERAMSTRFMRDAYDMLQDGWTQKEIDEAFFMGWREDEVNKVRGF